VPLTEGVLHCIILQQNAKHCNTLQHLDVAVYIRIIWSYFHNANLCHWQKVFTNNQARYQLQHNATLCNTQTHSYIYTLYYHVYIICSQHNAILCNTLTHSYIYTWHYHLWIVYSQHILAPSTKGVLHRPNKVPEGSLQHTATHYNTLQHTTPHYTTLQHTTTHQRIPM